jgi:hypothetical protein
MLIASAFAILLTWMVLAVVLVGVGSLVLRRFASDFFLLDSFWLGLCVSVALLEIWTFLQPVNLAINVLLCALAAIGLLENRAILFQRFKSALQTARWSIPLYLGIVMLLAFRASGPCDYYDTGLYGAPVVRWILTYPVVPGLANLNGRFGLNSSVFLCTAALSQGAWKGLGFHLLTGFLVAAIWFTLLPACLRLVRGSSASPADWFYSILAIPMGFWTARTPIVGTQTDEPGAIVCLVATGMLFEEIHRLQRNEAEGHPGSGSVRLIVAATLFALAVAFKQSTMVFAVLAWWLAFFWIWSKGRSTKNRNLYMVGAVALSVAVVLPWCARGVILSGYPLFPATTMAFPADWKVPVPVAHWYVGAVRSFARMPDVPLADTRAMAWLRPWLHLAIHDRSSSQVPFLISLSGLAVVLGLRLRKKTCPLPAWLWLLVPSFAGTFFWLVAAPALRFNQFAIWTTAATLGTWGIVSLAPGPHRAVLTKVVLAGLAALLIWCLISFGWKASYARLLASPGLEPLPTASVVARQTPSGLTVYVPAEGNQCWDAPLPCTSYFDETLRLRNPQSMRYGFTSQSQAQNLPRLQVALPASQPSGLPTFKLSNLLTFQQSFSTHYEYAQASTALPAANFVSYRAYVHQSYADDLFHSESFQGSHRRHPAQRH